MLKATSLSPNVFEFTPEDDRSLEVRGKMFVAVSFPESEVKKNIICQEIKEYYYGDLVLKPFNALRASLEKIQDRGVSVAVCTFVSGIVYSGIIGGAKVMIERNGALGVILDGNGEGITTASGYPKNGDVVILEVGKEEKSEISFSEGETVSGTQKDLLPETPQEGKQKLQESIKTFLDRFPRKRLYVRPGMTDEAYSQSKKLTFSVALILLVILFVSVGFGLRQRKINDLKSKYQGLLTESQSSYDQAVGIASTSPERSRELFFDSEQKLKEIQSLNVNDPKVSDLAKKIEEGKASILGEYEEVPQLFLDLGLLSSGFKGDKISVSGGNLYILDQSGKRIVSIAIDTKKSSVVVGPDSLDNPQDLASYETSVYVLGRDGVYEVDSGRNKIIDKTWDGNAFIRLFAGNIYVLDKSGNQIYRYQGQNGSFGDKQAWLASSTNLDFSNAVSWGIDGSIYVLYPNSKVLKFSQGSPQAFSVSGVAPEIGNIDAFYADPDNQYIYLLDKAGKRIVVVDKRGDYKAQYKDELIGTATNLVASEANKKIILLTGERLYSLDLKNL